MSWFIVSCSCESCGHDTSLVGPFDTEQLAEECLKRYGGSDIIWQGNCQTTKVVEAKSPKALLEQLEKDMVKQK